MAGKVNVEMSILAGLIVFTYHHSRDEGWTALAEAILGGGFTVVNAHPIKSEMLVATPKAQAKEPIQLDIAIVCRRAADTPLDKPAVGIAVTAAKDKLSRLNGCGFALSQNDERTVIFGQLLTTIRSADEVDGISEAVENALKGAVSERQRDTESRPAGLSARSSIAAREA